MTADGLLIRPLDPGSAGERELVAQRMQLTLIEVLGAQHGGAMYSMEWLRQRLQQHLDPTAIAAVFVAESDDGELVGHTIVRADEHEGAMVGLFSTTYVDPGARRQSIAQALLERGEAWMREQHMDQSSTCTSEGNHRLIGLYEKNGYRIVERAEDMVRLARVL